MRCFSRTAPHEEESYCGSQCKDEQAHRAGQDEIGWVEQEGFDGMRRRTPAAECSQYGVEDQDLNRDPKSSHLWTLS
jgi:hypothetical protein